MDSDRIALIIADIEKYIGEMDSLGIKTTGDLKEKKNFYSASMVLLTIFNRVIDLGQEIVLTKKLGVPATYGEIFSVMRKANVIDHRLSLELRDIVRIRNRLSHEYFAFAERDVFDGMRRIAAVRRFVNTLRRGRT